MGTRRDNRLSEGGPVRSLHAKQDHDRRNQELMKQLSNGTSSTKRHHPSPSSSYMSKSLTLELEKGLQGSSSGHGRVQGKKSYLRQTSSSVMRSSHGGVEKDSPLDGRRRKRDSSPSKTAGSLSNRGDKKGSPAGENPKRADVFERLSKVDSNKGLSGNRLPRDRSPQKGGRRSPQEKSGPAERSQGGRRTNSQARKRDVSPARSGGEVIRRGSSNRRSLVGGAGRGVPAALRKDEEVDSSAKLAQENIPESIDKDLDDLPARPSVGAPARPSHQAGDAATRPATLGVTPANMEAQGEPSSPRAGDSSPRISTEAPAKQRLAAKEQTSSGRRDRPGGDPKTPAERGGKATEKPPLKTSSQEVPKTKPKKVELEALKLPSPSEVIRKVRERVSDGSPTSKGPPAVDDDKDVCEADKAEDDREFYKISVQTRLVSYNNSTLVIKNTSKAAAVGDNAHSDAESDSAEATLQSSSAAAAGTGAAAADVEADTGCAAPRCHSPPELSAEAGDVGLFRSGSLRGKLSSFVSRGRNFLSDVYSATHSKLAARIGGGDDGSGPSTRSASPCSAASVDGDDFRVGGARDSDSGYFSISEANPGFLRRHVRAASWHCPNTFRGMPGATPLPPCPPSSSSRAAASPSSTSACSGGESARADTQAKARGESCVATAMDAEEEARPEGTAGEEGDAEGGKTDDEAAKGTKVDEEWIKKNILCTCKCQRKDEGAAGHAEDTTDDADADEAQSGANCESMISESSATESEAQEEEEEEEEMCFCSCHEVGPDGHVLQHLPEEVKELLDADHARMWWTITGNFGNILPIDWSKTYTRQQYLPVLNLNEAKSPGTNEETGNAEEDAEEEEEEEVAQDLDLHHLILNGLSAEPVKSAEEVIREIDDIMQEGSSSEDEGVEESTSSGENSQDSSVRPLPPPLYADKLKNMSVAELNESVMELELVIREYSETLINQLALRDELEYEKELKNSFISLLLQVQNKRRNFNVEKKKQKKYLTTVIPYDVGHGPPENQTLQILIKILMAINEDSPTVPTLLTDYILKVLCPS
ncbi:uncharacterized protein LOC122250266 isoform X2 [Penaeus japonicus]|uniref:uncharacterized protein LOC122250266 isoform X2 n=1 Tax=Penaeus japonicus TaxID=27405 RepID=UPI001C70DC9C|nr:uncharacterized protein LOC122250266 isoform X2 [Penaeus japonicus]